MKIALMTWFHYRNYGTALQVVALYNYLVQLGHNVDIIKYIPTNIRKKTIQDFSLSKVIERHKNKDINYQSYHGKDFCDNKKDELFQKFLDERVNFTDKCGTVTELENLDSEYDASFVEVTKFGHQIVLIRIIFWILYLIKRKW